MKKISKKILAMVVFTFGLSNLHAYACQTSLQSANPASGAKPVETLAKQDSILIYGRVVELSGEPHTVDSILIFMKNKGIIATTHVKKGEFRLQVPNAIEADGVPCTLMYLIKASNGRLIPVTHRGFILEGDSVYMLVDKKSKAIYVRGGIQNLAGDLYTLDQKMLSQKEDNLRNKKANGVIDQATYTKEMELLADENKKRKAQFIVNHPYSLYAPEALRGLVEKYLHAPWKGDQAGNELQEYKKLFFALEKPLQEKNHFLLEQLQNMETGKMPSFKGEMPDGKIFDLSGLKGKVVLIDFWGSWCGWCRKTHPHLKELYAKYKDKGFEIVGVGCERERDSREEQWKKFKKAIAEDGITWPQILMDPQKRDLTLEYGVSSFPSKFLIDRDGRLLLRVGFDNERLVDAKLEKLFNDDDKSSAKTEEVYEAEISSLQKEVNEVNAKIVAILQGKVKASEEEKKAFEEKFYRLNDEILTKHADYVSSHPEPPYSLTILKQNSHSFTKRGDSTFRMLHTLYNGLSNDVRARDTGNFVLETYIRNYANTSEGEKFDPFSFTNNDGRRIDLSNLKGKVVLLDFWGSWCHWCRAAHPYLKELYAKYKDQGLEIVGIAREHGSKDAQIRSWKKAIEEDGIPWLNVLNDFDGRDLVKEYAIRSYPSKVLIDKEGVIASRSYRSRELEEKIKALLNK